MLKDWFTRSLHDVALIAMVCLLVAAPVTLLLDHVHTQYAIAQTGYDIARATEEHRALTEQNKKLQIEAAVQGRTERVMMLARDRYGLSPAAPSQITVVEEADPLKAAPELPRDEAPQHAWLNREALR